MPEGYLSKVLEKKMLQCMGQTALALMTRIKTHPVVDEVALRFTITLYLLILGAK